MLFVALLKLKGGSAQERIARRMQWQHPEGTRPIAEYWLQTEDPKVIAIFEADSVAPMMAISGAWEDFFEVTIVPAMTAEEGLQLGKQMMQE